MILCSLVIVASAPRPAEFVIAVAFDAALSLLIFRHAERHGSRHATAWGVFTFLFAGLAIIVYVTRYAWRARR